MAGQSERNFHLILCRGGDLDACCRQVQAFFDRTLLVRYDALLIDRDGAMPAGDSGFWSRLGEGVARNQELLDNLVNEFRQLGHESVSDLGRVRFGYPSKVLHLIAHLLDGFVGIDSAFYNLEEDSHWVSEALEKKIRQAPESYWLLPVSGIFSSRVKAAFLHCDRS